MVWISSVASDTCARRSVVGSPANGEWSARVRDTCVRTSTVARHTHFVVRTICVFLALGFRWYASSVGQRYMSFGTMRWFASYARVSTETGQALADHGSKRERVNYAAVRVIATKLPHPTRVLAPCGKTCESGWAVMIGLALYCRRLAAHPVARHQRPVVRATAHGYVSVRTALRRVRADARVVLRARVGASPVDAGEFRWTLVVGTATQDETMRALAATYRRMVHRITILSVGTPSVVADGRACVV